MVMGKTRRAGLNWQRLGLRVAGAGLLAVTGAIHLDLYLTGYRSIPVIGWLFLLQVIAAFGLAGAVLVSGSRLAAAAGAGFALSTLHRDVRWLLAASDRDPSRRPGRDRQAGHDQAVRRHNAGHLQRASPVHLHC
jgi:hypothetical protein